MTLIPEDLFNQIIDTLAELTRWIYIALFVLVFFIILAMIIGATINIHRFNKNKQNQDQKKSITK